MTRLEEIEARCNAATPGPWYHDPDSGNSSRFNWLHYPDKEDAEFIAHAREDIPYLLQTIRELEDVLYWLGTCRPNEYATLESYRREVRGTCSAALAKLRSQAREEEGDR